MAALDRRNRLLQGSAVIDHDAKSVNREAVSLVLKTQHQPRSKPVHASSLPAAVGESQLARKRSNFVDSYVVQTSKVHSNSVSDVVLHAATCTCTSGSSLSGPGQSVTGSVETSQVPAKSSACNCRQFCTACPRTVSVVFHTSACTNV